MTVNNAVATRERTWPIRTMLTEGCARTLERAVAALPGVQSAVANYASGSLRVAYDAETIEPHA
ncbi:MAG: cation transporter, partial [Rhodanobacter sp.]